MEYGTLFELSKLWEHASLRKKKSHERERTSREREKRERKKTFFNVKSSRARGKEDREGKPSV